MEDRTEAGESINPVAESYKSKSIDWVKAEGIMYGFARRAVMAETNQTRRHNLKLLLSSAIELAPIVEDFEGTDDPYVIALESLKATGYDDTDFYEVDYDEGHPYIMALRERQRRLPETIELFHKVLEKDLHQ